MASQRYSTKSASSNASSPTPTWTMPRYIPQSHQHDFVREPFPYSGPLSRLPSNYYRNFTAEYTYDQEHHFGSANNCSAFDTTDARQTMEKFNAGSDKRYVPAGGMAELRRNMLHGSGEAAGIRSMVVESGAATGCSPAAHLSSPWPAQSGSDIETDFFNGSWESGGSNVDWQEVTESVSTENESSDGDGRSYEADGEAPLFDRARFESMWTGPTPCFLKGCRSKYLFQTSRSWYSHVKNVHKKALLCPKPGCPHTAPFANNTDLKRHIETKHEDKKPFKCEIPRCSRKIKQWSRKDKLKLHNRKYHSNFKCFFCSQNPRHERWFDASSELWEHTISDHPNG